MTFDCGCLNCMLYNDLIAKIMDKIQVGLNCYDDAADKAEIECHKKKLEMLHSLLEDEKEHGNNYSYPRAKGGDLANE